MFRQKTHLQLQNLQCFRSHTVGIEIFKEIEGGSNCSMTVTLLLAGTYVKFTEDRGYLAAKRFFYTALEKLSLFDNFHFYIS